jgi:predicted kinase
MKQPLLILIAGLPATGKTTLGEALAKTLGAVNLDSDKTRVALDFCGQYTAGVKNHVYEVMLATAEESLSEGRSVVVDATFVLEAWRQAFEAMAQGVGALVRWIYLTAAEDEIRRRMTLTRKYSEADFSVYLRLHSSEDVFNRPCLVLTTTEDTSAEGLLQQVLDYLASNEIPAPPLQATNPTAGHPLTPNTGEAPGPKQ